MEEDKNNLTNRVDAQIDPSSIANKIELLTFLCVCNFDSFDYPKLARNLFKNYTLFDFIECFKYSWQDHIQKVCSTNASSVNLKEMLSRPWIFLLMFNKKLFKLFKPNLVFSFQAAELFDEPRHVFISVLKEIGSSSIPSIPFQDKELLESLSPAQYLFFALHANSKLTFMFKQAISLAISAPIFRFDLEKFTEPQIKILAETLYVPLANYLADINFKHFLWPYSNANSSQFFILSKTNTKWSLQFLIEPTSLEKPPPVCFETRGRHFWELKLFPLPQYKEISALDRINLPCIATPELILPILCKPVFFEPSTNFQTNSNNMLDLAALKNVNVGMFTFYRHVATLAFKQIFVTKTMFDNPVINTTEQTKLISFTAVCVGLQSKTWTLEEIFYACFLNLLSPNLFKEYQSNFFFKVFLNSVCKRKSEIKFVPTLENCLAPQLNVTLLTVETIQENTFEFVYGQREFKFAKTLLIQNQWEYTLELNIFEPFVNLDIKFQWGVFEYENLQILLLQNFYMGAINFLGDQVVVDKTPREDLKINNIDIYFIPTRADSINLKYEANFFDFKIKFFQT